ncbi:hypothetical protein BDA96_01G559600 [Sorghum bicolor]|uniref:4Fe-4S ferredoxin-type domain-containing protein n=2 Tax=Sorghum bicolor TaxID=4558 RepID=A0A1Z5SBM1_SORBI|nr:hypothetical protein BDA96_01G559600 [Sorghum bicolor]OQU93344.1 hypothetical protein SORBI_3001G524150 [Sorghum bicolor]
MDGPTCRATGAASKIPGGTRCDCECEPGGCLLDRLLPTAAAPHGACPALFWPGSSWFRLFERPRLSPGTRCLLRCGRCAHAVPFRGHLRRQGPAPAASASLGGFVHVFRCWHLAAHHRMKRRGCSTPSAM